MTPCKGHYSAGRPVVDVGGTNGWLVRVDDGQQRSVFPSCRWENPVPYPFAKKLYVLIQREFPSVHAGSELDLALDVLSHHPQHLGEDQVSSQDAALGRLATIALGTSHQ